MSQAQLQLPGKPGTPGRKKWVVAQNAIPQSPRKKEEMRDVTRMTISQLQYPGKPGIPGRKKWAVVQKAIPSPLGKERGREMQRASLSYSSSTSGKPGSPGRKKQLATTPGKKNLGHRASPDLIRALPLPK